MADVKQIDSLETVEYPAHGGAVGRFVDLAGDHLVSSRELRAQAVLGQSVELAFVQALHTLTLPPTLVGTGRFDWILLDTPPAQSSYTRAALAAVHGIVLPAIIEPFAVKSINRLLETAQTLHGLVGRDGRVLGTYAVRWPRRPSPRVAQRVDR